MSPDGPEPPGARVVHNAVESQRYEITIDGDSAGFAAYVDTNGQRIFYHTETSPEFSDRGLAATLVAAALSDTRADGKRIVAVCPYVAKYVKKHHDFDDILDPVTPAATQAVRDLRQ
ncbi:GNAT family acetyltransferase [Mycobacterium sp. 852002-51163_SCH5372311]|uniref:GNAT family N-acetyltransferase n=1 Tax=Mycobacterium sp. 852002-51163_SCH5372311 TaxID=1834097 RepID=UPI0007FF385A|nr:GNAT family N-acetyltransferase [Mycobacterium sp. 852002-51163_SCH5372311]OBF86125.1 GNAT family acetyltransferase [Mycobacterium sp. 852002-51163_SCH5372311]